MEDIKKKLSAEIPDLKFYQTLVVLMIVANLLALSVTLYNQYNNQAFVRTSILSQYGGKATNEECLNFCAVEYPPVDAVVEDDVDEELVVSEGMFTEEDKGYSFELPTGVTVVENEELAGLTVMYPGEMCAMDVSIIYADAGEDTLKDWLALNYEGMVLEKLDYQVAEGDAYMMASDEDGESYKVFFMVGTEVVDVSYMYDEDAADADLTSGPVCDYAEDELIVEDLLKSFKLVAMDDYVDGVEEEEVE